MSTSRDFSTLPPHLIDLQNATSADLAYRNLHSARKATFRNYQDAMFFARHGRSTSLPEIEQMPISKFRSYLRRLNDLLEDEWEAPEM